jgi:hypothetical protein
MTGVLEAKNTSLFLGGPVQRTIAASVSSKFSRQTPTLFRMIVAPVELDRRFNSAAIVFDARCTKLGGICEIFLLLFKGQSHGLFLQRGNRPER